MMNWDYTTNGWMGGWMWIPMVLSFALLILVILGIVAIVRGMSLGTEHGAGTARAADDPLAIAARRFAGGEITKDEYEAIRATLTRSPIRAAKD